MDLRSKKMRYLLVGVFFLAMLGVGLYFRYTSIALTSLAGEALLIIQAAAESRTDSRVH
jgi:hypothetical protein